MILSKVNRVNFKGFEMSTGNAEIAEQERSQTVEQKESKRDKFVRLGELRVTNALEKIRLIGNLATSQYEYNQEDVDMIISSLNDGIAEHVAAKFNRPVKNAKKQFSFSHTVNPANLVQENQKE